MRVLFQADADLNQDIVIGVIRREPAIDFQTAEEARLRGLSDLEVLTLAATQQRILVSHDAKLFCRFHTSAYEPRRVYHPPTARRESSNRRTRVDMGSL